MKKTHLFAAAIFVLAACIAQCFAEDMVNKSCVGTADESGNRTGELVIIDSKVLGGQYSFCVHLPPGYKESEEYSQRYPVLYYLHPMVGYGAAPPIASMYIHAMQRGACVPFIVVVPYGGGGTFWTDVKKPIESVLIKEVIPYVDENYRTFPEQDARAVEGFSMGGWGTAYIGAKYPNLFCSFSPVEAPFLRPDAECHGGCNPDSGAWEWAKANAEKIRDNTKYIRVVNGGDPDDPTSGGAARPYHVLLKDSLGIENELVLVKGTVHVGTTFYEVWGDDAFPYYKKVFGPYVGGSTPIASHPKNRAAQRSYAVLSRGNREIVFADFAGANIAVTIFDWQGRVCKSATVHTGSIPLHTLKAGTYIAAIDIDGYRSETQFTVCK